MGRVDGSRLQSILRNVFVDNGMLRWRCFGAYTCHVATSVATSISISSTLWLLGVIVRQRTLSSLPLASWSWWLLLVLFHACMIPSAVAYIITLQNHDIMVSPGSHVYLYLPSFVSSRLIKLAGRMSTVEGCIRNGVALGLRVISGICMVRIMCHVFVWSPWCDVVDACGVSMAVVCAVLYHVHMIFWSRDVIVFPTVPQHRLYRLKDRIMPIVQRSIPVGVFSAACVWGIFGRSAMHGIVGIFQACMLVAIWSMEDSIIDIVITERPRLRDYDSKSVMSAMQECLDGKRGDIMQMLALYDLSLIPTDGEAAIHQKKDGSSKLSWRRSVVFGDDSGLMWNRLASLCVDILNGIVVEVEHVEDLVARSKSSGTRNEKKWNTVPVGTTLKQNALSADSMQCALHVAGYHQSIVMSIRFLSDMAYVSAEEDTYGILQLSEPRLGDILFVLTRLEEKLRHVTQWTAGVVALHGIRWRASGEELYSFRKANTAVDVVKSEIRIALENLGSKFGAPLLDSLTSAEQFDSVGSSEQQHMKTFLAKYCCSTKI
jgi:hypothetical protein